MNLFLLIIIVALVAFILYLVFYPRRKKILTNVPYLEALVALLDNNDNLAMKKLKEAVSIDTNLIDAYIRLGNLYRKKGDNSRAIQIHQSLTVRPTLRKDEEKKIYFALIQDFQAANRPNKAIAYLKEIIKIDKNDKAAKDLLIRTYEELESYADCLAVFQEDQGADIDARRRAFYYASLGRNRLKEPSQTDQENEKEAINLYKKALKTLANSLTALYYFAAYHKNKGELKKAREYYLKIVQDHPDYTFLIIQDLEKVFFELGLFHEVIGIYEKIFRANPKNFSVGFALAELYEKKNELEVAKDIYRKISELYPKDILPRLRILELLSTDKSLKKELKEIEKTVCEQRIVCKNCGCEVSQAKFICPKCHAIESFLPVL